MARKKTEEIDNSEGTTLTGIEQSLSVFEEFDKDFAGFKIKQAEISVIDTGSPALNFAIGINGFPRGRITHLYGPNGAGKTFLAMIAVKNALEADPNAVAIWFDAENSFSTSWGEIFGIWSSNDKTSRLKVIKGNNGKDIFERIVGKLTKDALGNVKKTKLGILDYIKEGKLNCPIIVIDSLADIISPKEQLAPVGGVNYAALAGFLTTELKRVSVLIEETNTALVCINQVRQNIDEVSQRREGKYHFPGGENLSHKVSLNILCDKVYSKDSIIFIDEKDENSIIGRKAKLTIKKNRFAPAPRTCYTTFIFSRGGNYNNIGIGDYEEEIVDLAIKLGIIKQGGAWYTATVGGKDERFQGTANLYDYFKNHKDELTRLHEVVKNTKPTVDVKFNANPEENEEELNELLEG